MCVTGGRDGSVRWKSLGGLEGRQLPAPSGGCSGAGPPLEACRQDLTSRDFPKCKLGHLPQPHPPDPYCHQMPSSARGMRLSPTSATTLICAGHFEQGSLTSRFLNTFCTIALPCSSEESLWTPSPTSGQFIAWAEL